jgi:hypothetical protein
VFTTGKEKAKLSLCLTTLNAIKTLPFIIKQYAVKMYCGSGGIAPRILNYIKMFEIKGTDLNRFSI